jgi:hypothetical protein
MQDEYEGVGSKMSRRDYQREYYEHRREQLVEQKQMTTQEKICGFNDGHKTTQQEHQDYWRTIAYVQTKKFRKLRANEPVANPWQSRPVYVPKLESEII